MTPSRRFTCLLLFFAVLAAGGCSRGPSVLLITVDSFRADEVTAVVNGNAVSPRVASLRADSVVFERAYCAAPWTTPSMMSFMTGLPAPAHGVEEHDRALAPDVGTLAERFRDAGFRTAAVVPALTLRPEYGFERGFEVYNYEPFGHDVITSPQLTSRVLHQLDKLKDERFFLWVHLWDPHYNYIPGEPWAGKYRQGTRPEREDVQCLKWIENAVRPDEALYLKGQYEAELAFTDEHIGEMLAQLDKLGRGEDTIVVVAGDHGEAFQEHGWLGHTVRVDQEMVGVPLVIRWKGKLHPAVHREPVAAWRLGATLLDLAGVRRTGFGLVPPLDLAPTGAGTSAPVVTQTMRMGCYTGLVTDRFSYQLDHRTCTEAVFDLSADPGESHDIAPAHPEQLASLRESLRAELKAIYAAKTPHAMLAPEIVHQAEAALRSIGYVGGGPTGKNGDREIVCAPLPDPTTRKVDAFGDAVVYQDCPPDGAWRCLEKRGTSAP